MPYIKTFQDDKRAKTKNNTQNWDFSAMENPINPTYYLFLFFIWFISIVSIYLKNQPKTSNVGNGIPQLLQQGQIMSTATFTAFSVHSIIPSLHHCHHFPQFSATNFS